MNQAEVVSMLLGYTAMPFEANPALFQSIDAPPNAQNMLRQMLQRNPSARPALKDVSLQSMLNILADVSLIARLHLKCIMHRENMVLRVLVMLMLSSHELCHFVHYAEGARLHGSCPVANGFAHT